MIRDEFFDYILHSGLEKITQPGFCISRYELSEIEKVPFINELFSIVENLYIIVSKEKMENGGICFNKYLTWDYIK